MLQRVLIAYTSRPPIIDYLSSAFVRRGIEVRAAFADDNTWFDRLVIHQINKLAHNFRLIPKSRNLFEDRPASHMNFRSARLREAVGAFDPDLVFHIRGLGFRSWAFEGARRKFAWWVESDERVNEALSEVPWFDHYFFINSASVEAARRAGYAHASYLPHAVDASVFRPLAGIAKNIDFAFVGLWSERREQFLKAALEVSPNGAIYGPKWQRKTFRDARFRRIVKGRYIAGEPLVRLYNRAKVVLNITNWGAAAGSRRSGMTMRLFEAPATGSLLLSDDSAELSFTVTPGVHVETFSDLDDFRRKLHFYLNHPTERQRIAMQGMQYVRLHHSYDAMVESILATYEATRARKG